MESKPNAIINALKRLERAGSEESRATEKLHAAVRAVAAKIEQIAPVGENLPRGYIVRVWHDYDGRPVQTVLESPQYGGLGEPVYVDQHQSREASLNFAAAIATGWLDELAEWLERRSTESAEAVATLERAAEAMR